MGANPRTKGAGGEREIVDMLNGMIYTVMKELEYPEEECLKAFSTVQRNQNQSAVGGNDLTNCMGMSIEVKRQEQLNVNTWWAQCLAAAERNNEMPVLMYRQNRKPWRFRTFVWLNLPGSAHIQVVAEFDEDNFRRWFKEWVRTRLLQGSEIRT